MLTALTFLCYCLEKEDISRYGERRRKMFMLLSTASKGNRKKYKQKLIGRSCPYLSVCAGTKFYQSVPVSGQRSILKDNFGFSSVCSYSIHLKSLLPIRSNRK